MFYKTGYCFTSKDLFDNFNISRLTTKKKFWGKDCKGDSKLDLVAKVDKNKKIYEDIVNDIDYLMSNFKGYQIYYRYQYKGGYREKPIYINSALKKIFIDNINKGKQYY